MQRVFTDSGHPLRDLLDEDRVLEAPWSQLPPTERVADRLADLLFGADEILGFLNDERAAPLLWIESDIRRLYTQIDMLMRKITD